MICMFIQMQTMDESHIEAQQMSQDEEDHESESVRSDATTEENDDDEGRIITIIVSFSRLCLFVIQLIHMNFNAMFIISCLKLWMMKKVRGRQMKMKTRMRRTRKMRTRTKKMRNAKTTMMTVQK